MLKSEFSLVVFCGLGKAPGLICQGLSTILAFSEIILNVVMKTSYIPNARHCYIYIYILILEHPEVAIIVPMLSRTETQS